MFQPQNHSFQERRDSGSIKLGTTERKKSESERGFDRVKMFSGQSLSELTRPYRRNLLMQNQAKEECMSFPYHRQMLGPLGAVGWATRGVGTLVGREAAGCRYITSLQATDLERGERRHSLIFKDPSTRQRTGTGAPVDRSTRSAPVRQRSRSYLMSDGYRTRQ
ncbi:hypothetical protein B0H10DRAFT_1938200 [Mycena sp. CBHHK59/15]|nr:hypothetical protein B0H10DRAFT_1938200 [Mycena sp. CBHHK59/15]